MNPDSSQAQLHSVMENLATRTKSAEQALMERANNLDPSNPAEAVQFQKLMADWSNAYDLMSGVIKIARDLIRTILGRNS